MGPSYYGPLPETRVCLDERKHQNSDQQTKNQQPQVLEENLQFEVSNLLEDSIFVNVVIHCICPYHHPLHAVGGSFYLSAKPSSLSIDHFRDEWNAPAHDPMKPFEGVFS